MKSVKGIVAKIRPRIAMYVRTNNLISLDGFLTGYMVAISQFDESLIDFNPLDFSDWARRKLKMQSASDGWAAMITRYAKRNHRDQHELFFELYDEFVANPVKFPAK